MPKFNVTYEIVTPESAEFGDAEERGFVAKGVSLREAVDLIGGFAHSADTWPCTLANPPRWFTNEAYNEGTREYFEFGREERRSLHLPWNVTPSSAIRVARLLGLNV